MKNNTSLFDMRSLFFKQKSYDWKTLTPINPNFKGQLPFLYVKQKFLFY